MSWFTTTTGARIGQLLDAIDFNEASFRQGGWTAAGARNTSLDTGDSITVPNADGTKSALALIQEMLEAERGVFYISKDGKATYEDRGSRGRRTTSSSTITTGALRSEPGFEFDQLANRQAVQRQYITSASGTTPNVTADGVTQVASNGVSIKSFGVQDGSDIQSLYIGTDTAALNLGEYIVNIRSSFVAPVTVELDNGSAASLTQMLSLELQDRVTVSDANSGTSGDYVIEGVEIEISEGGNSFVTTYTLSAYGELPFVFDSATQGIFAPPDGTVSYTECTSASRPSSPAANSYILETDTGRYFQYVGGTWVERIYPRLTY